MGRSGFTSGDVHRPVLFSLTLIGYITKMHAILAYSIHINGNNSASYITNTVAQIVLVFFIELERKLRVT